MPQRSPRLWLPQQRWRRSSTFPGTVPVTAQPLPLVGAGVTVFSKDYGNPRIYSTNVGYEQQLIGDYALYADFSLSKGVHLTRFINPNAGTGFTLPTSGQDTVNYVGVHNPFPNLVTSQTRSAQRNHSIAASRSACASA